MGADKCCNIILVFAQICADALTSTRWLDKLKMENYRCKGGKTVERRNPRIAHALFWDALALLGLSCYEFAIRLDDIAGEIKMVSHLIADGRLTWTAFLTTYMWDLNSFPAAGYMLLCILLALWVMISRRTRRACVFMIAPAAALTALGFSMHTSIFGETVKTIKMLPVVVLLALCVAHVALRSRRKPQPEGEPRRRLWPEPPAEGTPQPDQPVRHRRSDRHRAA